MSRRAGVVAVGVGALSLAVLKSLEVAYVRWTTGMPIRNAFEIRFDGAAQISALLAGGVAGYVMLRSSAWRLVPRVALAAGAAALAVEPLAFGEMLLTPGSVSAKLQTMLVEVATWAILAALTAVVVELASGAASRPERSALSREAVGPAPDPTSAAPM